MSTPLEDYALLADLHTGPLVSREGSVDWLCFPRFDSPALFCSLLGDEDNGRWQISAVDGQVESRRYVPDTFVLETVWRTPTGRVRVTDFLPPSDQHADLVRRVECLEGTATVRHDLRIRFDYGKVTPWVRHVALADVPFQDEDAAPAVAVHPRAWGAAAASHHPRADGAHEKEHAEGLDAAEGRAARARGANGRGDQYDQRSLAASSHAEFRRRVRNLARHVQRTDTEGHGLLAVAGPDALLLTGPQLHPYELDECGNSVRISHDHVSGPGGDIRVGQELRRGHRGDFALSAGERLDWVLTWGHSYRELPRPADPERAQRVTEDFWREWARDSYCAGDYEDAVKRSLLVLRGLTHSETGGIVAAPTAALPEDFGGERNWDYRYTWLRDASLTIEALVLHGHRNGALLWRDWLLRAVAGDPGELQIMYGVDGQRELKEYELDHLAGYENSRPVRIGNGAVTQYQADVAGEVMLALAALRDSGVVEDDYSWGLQCNLLAFCELHMDVADNGIWEMRGDPAYFTHGRVMMWAAFNEGLRAVEEHGLVGDADRWRRLRDRLHEEIWAHGYNADEGIFTQTYDNHEVDASLLQLPQTGFLAADDPAMLRTVARIERDLQDDSGHVRRYRTADSGTSVDGLSGHEYSFVICTFWLVEQYARSGRLDDARRLMDATVGVSSDLGLLSEEYDAASARLAGNFPQAFSHLGLIRAADAIATAEREG